MRKLLNITTIFLFTTLFVVNCFGQGFPRGNRPKTDADWEAYIEKYLKPKINDSIIAKLFKEADLVFEGEIITSTGFRNTMQVLYELEPYKVFKGNIVKDSTVKIMTNPAPQKDVTEIGEWSHGYLASGVYFVKKNDDGSTTYKFVNPKNAWVVYPTFTSFIKYEKIIKNIFHDKLIAMKGAKYEKTKIYHKKKENLGNIKKESLVASIDHFSRDTVPAGVLSGGSIVQIHGSGFGNNRGYVFLRDANSGGSYRFPIHPDRHILSWSNELIEVLIPSMGYAGDFGDDRESCAGTGNVRIISPDGMTSIDSQDTLFVPYAINNYAANSALEQFYTPYEVHLRNANSAGGYTFVYDTSFYNNRLAMAAFRRALETWRINFKQL